MNQKIKISLAGSLATTIAVLAMVASCKTLEVPETPLPTVPLTPPQPTFKPVELSHHLSTDTPLFGPLEYTDIPVVERRELPPWGPYFRSQVEKLLPEAPTAADKSIDAPWLDTLDFTGVSWSNKRTATVIHPRLVMMATHYTRAIGDQITWTDKAGVDHTRTLIDKIGRTSDDRTIGILDRPLPPEIKAYKMLPSGYKWENSLLHSWIIGTDQEKKALIQVYKGGITSHQDGIIYQEMVSYGKGNPDTDNIPEILYEQYISGDSGNPGFLVYEGELILLETHFYRTAGAFMSQTAWMINTAQELIRRHPLP